jgi:predicted nucleic acid-binding protein
MKAFLDTSVLAATFYGDHEHHAPSIELFLRHAKRDCCCAANSLAEVYASLTGMPGKHRASPDEAMLFLANIRERLTIVALTEEEYFKVVETSAASGVLGGGIYDAVLAHCALKARAEKIYTWDVKDFKRLGAAIGKCVLEPGSVR